ncbi:MULTISPECIES: amidophosphoribosyltransferase [Moraxella]|uniref:Amidophosphoribosyltransferase n=1 Tax=Moraxella porci DSM 25326 TaxID=573983 RepID=A0A1T0CWL8_9GAMM|nr:MULTISPECIES: amidophosphoribosyltransferase [Moraxella]MDH2274226.1 amidophosphoribosyltransferase [Moraxella porci]OOS26753.1 amidophosphoribosyltransferase [Moraxella porci DSM 25326]PNP98844.1 amidophosphoribosyltransferase [Moraxella sp. RCAD0137]
MCGVIGVMAHEPVNQILYDGLTMLQHRGQDAAGIVTLKDNRLYLRKDNGMVRDVFLNKHMVRLVGNCGIGHVRYPTAGTSSTAEAQPLYVNSPYGVALAHNGNLTNAEKLARELYEEDRRHLNTQSDSEVLLNIFAHELQKFTKTSLEPQDIFDALKKVYKRCEGAYGVVAIITGHGMVAFRDPNGIRPLIYGRRLTEKGVEYMVASESVALQALGFEVVRDIAPGEAIYVDLNHNLHTEQCVEIQEGQYTPCIFEYVYFARPDSIIDNISVHKARMRMGEKLAEQILREWGEDHGIDVVIPIPDTSRNSALELAHHLNVKYREGFNKNRYIGRTFIMPGQQQRKKSVRQKLNAVSLEFKNKNVLLVDDSIVRGTTCHEIIQMARDAGAKNVFFASAAPPVMYPNVYGIDMPVRSELISSGRSVEEVREIIGADRLIFQDLDDLIEAVNDTKHSRVHGFDCSVFDGKYIAGKIDEAYLTELQNKRNDAAKDKGISLVDTPVDMTGVSAV